jgi:tRNA pseudouridine38-40 synthase
MCTAADIRVDSRGSGRLERRVRLLLAYDGRQHGGWPYVGDGRSVQEAVENAVRRILKSEALVRVHASGRTDAGVHALGQVVHFAVPDDWRMDGAAWCRAINSFLPPSIQVLDASYAVPGFHARHSATGKHYQYKLFNGALLHPLDHGVWGHWPWPLDVAAMRDAIKILPGEHDFSAFAAYRHDGTDYPAGSGRNVRRIWRADLCSDGRRLTIDIEGSGFLYKMVRLLVGALIHVGRGSLDRTGLEGLLECRLDARGELVKSPLCAPADGLYMVEVFYGERPAPGSPAP